MSKLTDDQIRDYHNKHLPYIRRVMWGHYKLTEKGEYKDDPAILDAAFLGSLIAGRMILEFIGITLNQSTMELRSPSKKRADADSVSIVDINGDLVDIVALNSNSTKRKLLSKYIKMAHKSAGHMTIPEERPWKDFHDMIKEIDLLLDQQLKTLRPMPDKM